MAEKIEPDNFPAEGDLEDVEFAGGTGHEEDPYLLSDPEHIFLLRYFQTTADPVYFEQIDDIDLENFELPEWVPTEELGDYEVDADVYVSGEFPYDDGYREDWHYDGKGHTIKNLKTTLGDDDLSPLFGYVGDNSLIQNLKFTNMEVTQDHDPGFGGIHASLFATSIGNWQGGNTVIVKNIELQGKITCIEGSEYDTKAASLGELLDSGGDDFSVIISNIKVDVDFEADVACGLFNNTEWGSPPEVKDCAIFGTLKGRKTSYLIGEGHQSGTIERVLAAVEIDSEGDVKVLEDFGGEGTVEDSYYNGTLATVDQNDYSVEERSTDELTEPFAANTYENWDTELEWGRRNEEGYPLPFPATHLRAPTADLTAGNVLLKAMAGSAIRGLTATLGAEEESVMELDTEGLPEGPNILTIFNGEDFESIIYQEKGDGEVLDLTREVDGEKQEWPSGAEVARVHTAEDMRRIYSYLAEVEYVLREGGLWRALKFNSFAKAPLEAGAEFGLGLGLSVDGNITEGEE